ncbi:MAG: ABC transporter substrate-binding protein [Planctomycetota bacterium]
MLFAADTVLGRSAGASSEIEPHRGRRRRARAERHPTALVAPLFATCWAIAAQESAALPSPVPIGVFFWHDAPNDEAAYDGIERGLRAGGVSCTLTVRRAESDQARAAEQLTRLAASHPRLVFAMGTQAALLARQYIHDCPIVFTAVTHPVEAGVAESWQSAGANVCGNSNWIESETMLSAFRVCVPRLARLGVLRSSVSGVVSAAELRQMQRYLREPQAPRVELLEEVVQSADELDGATARLRARGAQAVWVPIDNLVYENTAAVLEALRGSGIPIVSSAQRGAAAGATLGVVVDYGLLGERAAALARRVLRGQVAPADLPVQTMQSHQLVVNLAAAKACAYEVPLPSLLVADRILDRVEAQR